MPTIMFSNLKGGVAKTINAVAVAECLVTRHPSLHYVLFSEVEAGQEALGNALETC